MPEVVLDSYVVDSLLRDLVGHGRSASTFLVYLFLWRHTYGEGRPSAAFSHAVLAGGIGMSKRAVQNALKILTRRKLIKSHRRTITAVPQYTVLRPWVR